MSVVLSPLGGAGAQFLDNNGTILTGGKLYTYAAGTTVLKTTYTSSSGSSAHTNPIILDSSGRVPGGEIWITSSDAYKIVVKDSTNVVLGTYDNLNGADAAFIPFTGFDGQTGTVSDLAGDDGADWIGFQPSGGTARSVQAKLRDTVSVMDFGAVGDGTTDDAPAILAAAQYVDSIGGGTVYFPPPPVSYAMNPTYFSNLSNVAFVGNESKIISRQPANEPYSIFHMIGCSNLEFFGLDIDGRYYYWKTQPVQPTFNNFNIVLIDCTNVRVHHNYLHDSGYNTGSFDLFGDGVYISGTNSTLCNNISVTNNHFHNDGRWSVAVLAGSFIQINDNTCTRSSPSDVMPLGFVDLEYNPGVGFGENISISNNIGQGPCEIVSSQNISPGYRNLVISNNSLNGYYQDGSQSTSTLYAVGISIRDAVEVSITDNVLYGIRGDNIQLTLSSKFMLANNLCITNGTRPTSGFYIGASDGTISNNRIVTTGSDQAAQISGDNLTVIGNYFENPTNWAMTLGGTGNRIISNYFNGTAAGVCSISGDSTIVTGNSANSSGRLTVGTGNIVIGNAMSFNTSYGNWWEGGGRYTIPDGAYSRSMLWFTAAPTTGTWTQGDIVWSANATSGQPAGWMCVAAGTPGTWKAMGNLA